MKKILSAALALSMLTGLLAFSANAAVLEPLPPGTCQYLGEDISPRGTVETYSFSTTGTSYLELPNFTGEYRRGDQIHVTGTWKPSFGQLAIEFYADDGSAVLGYLNSGNDYNVFQLNSSSIWHLHVKSVSGTDLSGTLQLTID